MQPLAGVAADPDPGPPQGPPWPGGCTHPRPMKRIVLEQSGLPLTMSFSAHATSSEYYGVLVQYVAVQTLIHGFLDWAWAGPGWGSGSVSAIGEPSWTKRLCGVHGCEWRRGRESLLLHWCNPDGQRWPLELQEKHLLVNVSTPSPPAPNPKLLCSNTVVVITWGCGALWNVL